MFGKAQLKQIGYNKIDKTREYFNTLNAITHSQSPTSWREAYAYGLGMMMQFN